MTSSEGDDKMVHAVSTVVAAYVAHNAIALGELPALISNVHAALSQLGRDAKTAAVAAVPAVSIKKSMTPDYLVCLEDGKKFKSLKRHLRTQYDLTPEQYRAKWGLPADYPMVAPNYASERSKLARKMGLGQQRGKKGST